MSNRQIAEGHIAYYENAEPQEADTEDLWIALIHAVLAVADSIDRHHTLISPLNSASLDHD